MSKHTSKVSRRTVWKAWGDLHRYPKGTTLFHVHVVGVLLRIGILTAQDPTNHRARTRKSTRGRKVNVTNDYAALPETPK